MYIEYIKYYKGEKTNPYANDKDINKSALWEYERQFYHYVKDSIKDIEAFSLDSLNNYLAEMDTYNGTKYIDPDVKSKIHPHFIGVLFNRYGKMSNSLSEVPKPFGEFVNKYYK